MFLVIYIWKKIAKMCLLLRFILSWIDELVTSVNITSAHNRVQNKHVLHRCRLLYLRVVQRVLKPHRDSRRLDWTRLGRCEHRLTLESDWTELDSTRLCWCVRTLTHLTGSGLGSAQSASWSSSPWQCAATSTRSRPLCHAVTFIALRKICAEFRKAKCLC